MSRVTVSAEMSTGECIRAMTDLIVEHFQPERIILFGSQARGDTDRDSDVDLLVVMAGPVDRRETAVQIRRVLQGISVAKDIVVTSSEEIARRGHVIGTVLRPALREGKVLFHE
jgi:predicted nucleotidyltransferase